MSAERLGSVLRWAGRLAVALIGVWLIFEASRFPDFAMLETSSPRSTAMMELRAREAAAAGEPYEIVQIWVPLEKISKRLRKAVLVAEDDRFYQHDGFDYEEIRDAIEDHVRDGKKLRGASTISQQLTKNLWLDPGRSLTRKFREAVYTWALERRLEKDRILEIYLNVVEWGPGIFGAEAAAQNHFGVSVGRLSAEQAALLAAALPNPLVRDPSKPTRGHRRRARRIMARLGERATPVKSKAKSKSKAKRTPTPTPKRRVRPSKKSTPKKTRPVKTPTATPTARRPSPTRTPSDLLLDPG